VLRRLLEAPTKYPWNFAVLVCSLQVDAKAEQLSHLGKNII
jgi:hypothetical protein